MKIWSKGFDNAPEIDAFTVGKDRELDLMLAPWDILGTMAHITMLSEVGLLGKDELDILLPELTFCHAARRMLMGRTPWWVQNLPSSTATSAFTIQSPGFAS